jgi:hypothetical protein
VPAEFGRSGGHLAESARSDGHGSAQPRERDCTLSNALLGSADLTINADGIEQIMNLFDEYAVEEALQWNEKLGSDGITGSM